MTQPEIVFLGGIFCNGQLELISSKSTGVVQNAADSLQKKIIEGLDENLIEGVRVLNLPFVGSYPRRFGQIWFPSFFEPFGQRSVVIGRGFLNLSGVKLLSRFFSSLFGLLGLGVKSRQVVVVYSAHLPFLCSALLYRALRANVRVCLIVPDLPEYMGDSGGAYTLLKSFDVRLFYFLAKKVDYLVVLTKYMANRLGVEDRKVVVVEGVAAIGHGEDAKVEPLMHSPVRSFLYTGTLARRYGIVDLVDAFCRLSGESLELWVCGDGDSRDYIETAALRDKRIKFFGQISREKAIQLQRRATVLVNPRPSEGDFTKYSFPSKIMEYMATGRPVLMYKLGGIPDEYDGKYISPERGGVEGLSESLERVAGMSDEDLEEIGRDAKKFVLEEKSPSKQAARIINLITECD